MKYAIVVGDTNDADYVSEKFEIDNEFEDMLKRVAKALRVNNGSWNKNDYNRISPHVEYKDLLSEEDIDWFNDYCPRGIHTIESITFAEVINEERIF